MVTKEIAAAASHGTKFYHVGARNADGTPVRCRVMGKCQTWKRQPEKFKLPVKRGMYESFYITETNGEQWAITPCAAIVEGP